jgi:hypothetical protein
MRTYLIKNASKARTAKIDGKLEKKNLSAFFILFDKINRLKCNSK